MCGIAGIAHPDQRPIDRDALEKMTRTLSHRGPDDEGFFVAPGIGLGHRRLSVIDLVASRQPMESGGGQVLTYNGEVYGFAELRRELEGRGERFRTSGDTEVVLRALGVWGEEALGRFNGMFALGLWDSTSRSLLLARDRMGKKPLHWALLEDGTMIFGSELKALLAHPAMSRAIDPSALRAYLVHEYVPAPATIFRGAFKIPPGGLLRYRAGSVDTRSWWDIEFPQRHAPGEPADLLGRIQRATARRLVADVPVGVLLSGGVDSSTIAACATRAAGKVRTFTIGFGDGSFDESTHARRVARHLGTEHHEERLEPGRIQDLCARIADVLDEPLADHSILPTFLLCRFARESVTVALGGDGGDELFAGYVTFQAESVARLVDWLPRGLIDRARSLAEALLPVSYRNISGEFALKRFLAGLAHDRALRHQIWLGAVSPEVSTDLVASHLRDEARRSDPMAPVRAHLERTGARLPLDRLLVQYCKLYMADDILVKVDRASMASSLEVRAPLLDPDVVSFATSIPPSQRIRGLSMKRILRDAVRDLLPPGVADRPKKGFGVPLGSWFRGPLRPLLLDSLSPGRLAAAGLVDPPRVTSLIEEHTNGRRDHRKVLFALLVLHLWHARWVG
ncbi:MAG: asparagine synthase (glutamine-hydrolyzing) [Deltaproteobacteria bacterium]|nr:asparagine synthase (glutamine-hydrolyzing) [Deltaproteobacteria bacterium]